MPAKETKISDVPIGTVCSIPVFLSATYFNSICSLRLQLQLGTILNIRTNSTIALYSRFHAASALQAANAKSHLDMGRVNFGETGVVTCER
jgi:hypothetical protein